MYSFGINNKYGNFRDSSMEVIRGPVRSHIGNNEQRNRKKRFTDNLNAIYNVARFPNQQIPLSP